MEEKGTFHPTGECQLINIQGVTESEHRPVATMTVVISTLARSQLWSLVGESHQEVDIYKSLCASTSLHLLVTTPRLLTGLWRA